MKRLPAITSELRIRMEGAVEEVEWAVRLSGVRMVEREPRSLPALADRWPKVEVAAGKVVTNSELARLSAAFADARTSLEAEATRECELLGLGTSGALPAKWRAIHAARCSVLTPGAELIFKQQAFPWPLVAAATAGIAGIGAFDLVDVPVIPAIGLFWASLVAVERWLDWRRWKITSTHVVVRKPRETALDLTAITEVSPQPGLVVISSATQTLRLQCKEPHRVAKVLELLRRRVPTVPSGGLRRTLRGRTAIIDAHGVAVIHSVDWQIPGLNLARFEPRALAAACNEAYWRAQDLTAAPTRGGKIVSFPDGDSLFIAADEAWRYLTGARTS